MAKRSISKVVTDRSLPEVAYQEVRRRILEGAYAPGEALSEYRLAADLQISRTPIREALRRLEAGGLTRSIPGRGVFVSDLTIQDIVEVYQLREQLEVFAVELAARHMTEEQLHHLRADHGRAVEFMEKNRPRDAYDMAVKMHERIIAAANNGRLAKFIDELEDQTHRFGLLTLKHAGRLKDALREHAEIIDALARRDGKAAAITMRSHLIADRDVAIRDALPMGIPSQLSA